VLLGFMQDGPALTPSAGRLHDPCGHFVGVSACPDCSSLSEPALHACFYGYITFRPDLDGPRLGARDSSALFHWKFGCYGGFVSSGGATAAAGGQPAVYNVRMPGLSVPMLAVWTEVGASALDSHVQTCNVIPSACAWYSVSNLFGRYFDMQPVSCGLSSGHTDTALVVDILRSLSFLLNAKKCATVPGYPYYYFSRHYQIALKIKPLYLTRNNCYLTSNTTRVVQQ
jgi:hypothetical protein